MAENYHCILCTGQAEIACRCTQPPALLCSTCLGPHVSKTPEAYHLQTQILATDLEETKFQSQKDMPSKKSLATRMHIENYRNLLLLRLDEFCENRFRQIDATIDDLTQRADFLKEHIKQSKQDCVDEFTNFVTDLLSADKYDHLLQE